jgi:membrane fusion protein (multidrug efflux system)
MQIKRWLISIIIVMTVIAGLGFVKFQQIQAAIAYGESFPEPSATVESTYVATIEHADTTKVVGELRAPRMITLTTEFPGIIVDVGFKPGEAVEAGQVLLRQDTSIEQANLRAAVARLNLATSTFARRKQLIESDRISQDQVDNAEAEMLIAKAEVERLNSVINKMTIVAPFSGTVGLEQFQVGQMLPANHEVTTVIGNDATIWVDFSIPQTLTQANIGDKVELELIGKNQTKRSARIIAKNPALDSHSRQQNYRAVLDNTDDQLSPNQMVNVYVSLASSSKIAVPTNAISRNHFGHFVYLLEKDNQQNYRAKPLQIEPGVRVGDMQIVLSGLRGGELIATKGAFKLSEDLLVYTQPPESSNTLAGGQP